MINIRKHLSNIIYNWADRKYGVKARGEVKGVKVLHHPVFGSYGVSDFTPKQHEMINKWHKWMRIKNKVYGKI